MNNPPSHQEIQPSKDILRGLERSDVPIRQNRGMGGLERWFLFAELAFLVAIGSVFLVAGASILIGRQFDITSPIFQGAVVFLAALGMLPFGLKTAPHGEKEFQIAPSIPRNLSRLDGADLTGENDIQTIADELRRRLQLELPVEHLHIFLADPLSGYYLAANSEDGKPTSDLRFSGRNPLARALSQQRDILLASDCAGLDLSGAERARLDLLAAQLFVPLPGKEKLLGWMALGRRKDQQPYSSKDLEILSMIANRTARAIERAQLVEIMENRIQEMVVLTRVAQGVNVTLALDDIYELIYAQTIQILPADEFRILLFTQPERAPVQVFVSCQDERCRDEEGIRLDGALLPEYDAITSGSGYLCEDYFRELRQRAVDTPEESHCAWMAVPLRAGAEAIGAIRLGRRDATAFTGANLQTLQAIADLAAGAIVKTRLLAESEQRNTMTDQALAVRVEELSVMQSIDRELNTSLDVSRAMKITLDWAMRQSGATAGLVGMVEAEGIRLMAFQGYTSELDGYQTDLLPADRAHLYELVSTQEPVLIYPDQAQKTLLEGARSQVIVPIQREESVTGVILLESHQEEVCSEEALGFLMRLGDHASIAIANAQLYDAVQAANVAKSEFVSFVAHELKNPMTSIKGYTELLAARAVGPVNETQASFLQVICSNIDRMNTLVSDLNDLSKIEAGRMRLEFARIDLKDVVVEVERSTRRQIEEKGQTFEIRIPADLPIVWADNNRLMQVLINLVSNAHKYTDAGGKIILGAEVFGEPSGSSNTDWTVHVWVCDNGIGITDEDKARIFQKFFRSDDPKTREIPGAGLGLNITRSLVEMQEGKIWFESEFRKGTTFHFTIPVAKFN